MVRGRGKKEEGKNEGRRKTAKPLMVRGKTAKPSQAIIR
jgi:hypothetical protein